MGRCTIFGGQRLEILVWFLPHFRFEIIVKSHMLGESESKNYWKVRKMRQIHERGYEIDKSYADDLEIKVIFPSWIGLGHSTSSSHCG